jgi:hemoglobin/transferrin/lactoferrin receptor protein
MKTQLLLTLLFFTLLGNILAQQLTIIDQQTKAPLGLVSIISKDSQVSVITNSQGIADISGIIESKVFEIRLIGYENRFMSLEQIKAAGFIIRLKPMDYLLNQVVVSAQRWSSEKALSPTKVISIQRSQAEMQNPQTAADLLNISGEVFIQKSQMGGGSPMIRGFSANRLLISVDGVRMNTAIFRGGNLQNVISIDPFSLSNTEVYFGPGSVIYGSDAIGGVMSFFTILPEFADSTKMNVKGNLDIRYSSSNREKTGHFDVNIGWKKFAMTTSLSYFTFDDMMMGKYGPDDYLRTFYVRRQDSMDIVVDNPNTRLQNPTSYKQTNFLQKFKYQANNYLDIYYTFNYSQSSDVPRYDRLIRTKDGLPRYAEWHYGPQKWMMNLVNLDYHKSSFLSDQWSIKAAYQHFEESRINRKFNSDIRNIGVEKVDAYSINADFKKNIRDNDMLYYGMEWVYNSVNSHGSIENIQDYTIADGPARYPKSDWASYAAYINYSLHMSEDLLIVGGARYNWNILNANFNDNLYSLPYANSSISNGALVGNLGLNYHPGNNWVITTNLSTGFRSPNVDDMAKVFDSEPGAVVVPNPDIKAEYIYNAELGLSKGLGQNVSVEAHVFYSILDHAMVRRDFQLNGQDSMMYQGEMSKIQAIQNAAYARVWGLSMGLEARLMKGLQLSSRLNYQKGEDEMDDGSISPARHAAPLFGRTSLSLQKKKWVMDLYALYSGEISYDHLALSERSKTYLYALDTNGNPYSPAWYTINYKLTYHLNDLLQMTLGLENITNQRYRPYSSGIAAAGMNFIFSIKLHF